MRIVRHILLLVLLSIAGYAYSQVGEHRNDFSVGFTGGYTFNKMDYQPAIKQNFKPSPMFGFAMRYICEKYFTAICGVEIEVQYNNLGWKEFIEDGTDNQFTKNLHFIQMPIMMQMGWGRERNGLKFVFEAGPQLGYYLGGDSEFYGNPWNTSNRPNDVTYQYDHDIDNRIDYGIAAGAGLEFSSPVGHFLLHGRYYFGLADLYDNSKKGYFGRSANQTLQVKLTYLFDIVKTKQ